MMIAGKKFGEFLLEIYTKKRSEINLILALIMKHWRKMPFGVSLRYFSYFFLFGNLIGNKKALRLNLI